MSSEQNFSVVATSRDWSQFLAGYSLAKSLYSINELIELMGLGRTFIYQKIASGDLPIVKVGKRTLVAAPDIVQFIESHRLVQNKEAA